MPTRHHAVLVQAIAIDLHVLGMDMEEAILEVVDGALVVDHLPDQVRRVEVEAEVRRRE